jgi:hypothetical protein
VHTRSRIDGSLALHEVIAPGEGLFLLKSLPTITHTLGPVQPKESTSRVTASLPPEPRLCCLQEILKGLVSMAFKGDQEQTALKEKLQSHEFAPLFGGLPWGRGRGQAGQFMGKVGHDRRSRRRLVFRGGGFLDNQIDNPCLTQAVICNARRTLGCAIQSLTRLGPLVTSAVSHGRAPRCACRPCCWRIMPTSGCSAARRTTSTR